MRVFTCSKCSRIHLEIGNIQIHFESIEKLKRYSGYLDSIDVAYYAAINRSKGLLREIILPLDVCNSIHLTFTTQEFETLKGVIHDYLMETKKVPGLFIKSNKFQMVNPN
jgi:hypothetical protein